MRSTKCQQEKRLIIIGAGVSGILSAIKLRERGFNNVVIYEKGNSPGGTWRENTYPGLACDVPAHTYTFSFEPNPDWSRVFAPGPEIRDYIEHTAKKYGLTDESIISMFPNVNFLNSLEFNNPFVTNSHTSLSTYFISRTSQCRISDAKKALRESE